MNWDSVSSKVAEPTQGDPWDDVSTLVSQAPEKRKKFGWELPKKPFFTLSDTVSGIADAVSGLKVTAPAAYYRLTEGLQRPDLYSPEAKAAFEEERKFTQELEAKSELAREEGTASSVGESFREVAPSLGFSAGSLAAGLGGRLAAAGTAAGIGTMVGTPGIGTAGGAALGFLGAGAASGASAYRMAGAQFLDDAFYRLEQDSFEQNGRALTEQEKANAYSVLKPIAENSAMWEAGPEAISNAVTLGLGKVALGLGGKKTVEGLAKTALGRAGMRTAALTGTVGTELGTETVTQLGQGLPQAQAEAFQRGEPISEAVSPYDRPGGVMQAFKDVAPATLAQITLIGGAAKTADIAYKGAKKAMGWDDVSSVVTPPTAPAAVAPDLPPPPGPIPSNALSVPPADLDEAGALQFLADEAVNLTDEQLATNLALAEQNKGDATWDQMGELYRKEEARRAAILAATAQEEAIRSGNAELALEGLISPAEVEGDVIGDFGLPQLQNPARDSAEAIAAAASEEEQIRQSPQGAEALARQLAVEQAGNLTDEQGNPVDPKLAASMLRGERPVKTWESPEDWMAGQEPIIPIPPSDQARLGFASSNAPQSNAEGGSSAPVSPPSVAPKAAPGAVSVQTVADPVSFAAEHERAKAMLAMAKEQGASQGVIAHLTKQLADLEKKTIPVQVPGQNKVVQVPAAVNGEPVLAPATLAAAQQAAQSAPPPSIAPVSQAPESKAPAKAETKPKPAKPNAPSKPKAAPTSKPASTKQDAAAKAKPKASRKTTPASVPSPKPIAPDVKPSPKATPSPKEGNKPTAPKVSKEVSPKPRTVQARSQPSAPSGGAQVGEHPEVIAMAQAHGVDTTGPWWSKPQNVQAVADAVKSKDASTLPVRPRAIAEDLIAGKTPQKAQEDLKGTPEERAAEAKKLKELKDDEAYQKKTEIEDKKAKAKLEQAKDLSTRKDESELDFLASVVTDGGPRISAFGVEKVKRELGATKVGRWALGRVELYQTIEQAAKSLGIDPALLKNSGGAHQPSSGRSVAILDNIRDAADLRRVITHEVVGHGGMYGIIKQFPELENGMIPYLNKVREDGWTYRDKNGKTKSLLEEYTNLRPDESATFEENARRENILFQEWFSRSIESTPLETLQQGKATGPLQKIWDAFVRAISRLLGRPYASKEAQQFAYDLAKTILANRASFAEPTIQAGGDVVSAPSTVTTEQDRAYSEAVQRGDMETAQRMVDEAAEVYESSRAPKTIMVGSDAIPISQETVIAYIRHERSDKRSPANPFLSRQEQGKIGGLKAALTRALKKDGLTFTQVAPILVNLESSDRRTATYDDNGNLIPLSQRFNPERTDIRHSVMAKPDLDAPESQVPETERQTIDTASIPKAHSRLRTYTNFTAKTFREYLTPLLSEADKIHKNIGNIFRRRGLEEQKVSVDAQGRTELAFRGLQRVKGQDEMELFTKLGQQDAWTDTKAMLKRHGAKDEEIDQVRSLFGPSGTFQHFLKELKAAGVKVGEIGADGWGYFPERVKRDHLEQLQQFFVDQGVKLDSDPIVQEMMRNKIKSVIKEHSDEQLAATLNAQKLRKEGDMTGALREDAKAQRAAKKLATAKKNINNADYFFTPEEKVQMQIEAFRRTALTKGKGGNTKERRIKDMEFKQKLYEAGFYEHPAAALHAYVGDLIRNIPDARIFGPMGDKINQSTLEDTPLSEESDVLDPTSPLGREVYNLKAQGKLSVEQINRIRDMTQALLTHMPPNSFLRGVKDFNLVAAIGNPISAIKQLPGEYGLASAKYGFSPALRVAARGLFRNWEKQGLFDVESQLGLSPSYEIARRGDPLGKFAAGLARWSGFRRMDLEAANVLANAHLESLAQMKEGDRKKALEKWRNVLDGDDKDAALQDVSDAIGNRDWKAKNVDNVAYYGLSEDRPTGLHSMPVGFLKAKGLGQLPYNLRGWGLFDLDRHKKNIYDNLRSGDPARIRIAMTHGVYIMSVMVAAGMAADEAADWLLNKPSKPISERAQDSLLKMFFASQYQVRNLTGDRPDLKGTLLDYLSTPALNTASAIWSDAVKAAHDDKKGFLEEFASNKASLRIIPLGAGTMARAWMGGSKEDAAKALQYDLPPTVQKLTKEHSKLLEMGEKERKKSSITQSRYEKVSAFSKLKSYYMKRAREAATRGDYRGAERIIAQLERLAQQSYSWRSRAASLPKEKEA